MNNSRYSQLQFIAPGGFADVYRALDNWTGRPVAIKKLRNPTPELLPRFMRERDMLTIHRDNPFVVNILDSNLDGPDPYLALEYSSHGSLQKYVANRRDWRRIARWLWDIAYGLTIIHERGDLIRDVKPSNLLMFKRDDGSDLIKIADFGVAQRPDNPSGGMTTSVFGTKGYIDPVAQISRNFRAASDIFSLGVTMRELLTGSRVSWIRIPGPPEFRALIASMTDSNVDNRPTAREIFERIQAILQALPVPAVTKPAGEGLGWLLVGAAALLGACYLADGSRN
jgi:serine/threonine protein kinase